MKVLLFNIADYLTTNNYSPTLACGYLKSYFDKYSSLANDIKIIVSTENIKEEINFHKPEIIGISVASEFYPYAQNIARQIKKSIRNTITIIGGYHITNLPETLDEAFDFGIIGEGEVTFAELISAVFRKEKKINFTKIQGLIFRDESGKINFDAKRDLICNLDSVPFPYRSQKQKLFFTHIITSRGCPFVCSFCASSVFWNQTIRFNSAEYVINEMLDLIIKRNVKHITIWDDLFIGDINRLRKICSLICSEKKIFRKITLGVSARADLIAQHPEIVDLFKEMNVIRVSVGFESGSDRMLKLLKGKSASLENNKKALNLLQKHKFLINGGFIIGSPDETFEDLEGTCRFILKSRLNGGYAGLAIPYPNTKFWTYAEQKGLVNRNMDFTMLKVKTDFKSLCNKNFILLSEYLDRKTIVDYGIKIQNYFARAELKTYFIFLSFSLKNIQMFFISPSFFLESFLGAVSSFLKIFFRRSHVPTKKYSESR